MTETTTCPPWCTNHDEYGAGPIHKTRRVVIRLPGADGGSLRAFAGIFTPSRGPEAVVHGTWYPPGGPVLDSDLYVPLDDAHNLAALAEILAHATPDQHRELAAAIRDAAAQITGASDG